MSRPLINRPGYSIAAVSKLTGVSCHALRVWERRYGFPVPQRSPRGIADTARSRSAAAAGAGQAGPERSGRNRSAN